MESLARQGLASGSRREKIYCYWAHMRELRQVIMRSYEGILLKGGPAGIMDEVRGLHAWERRQKDFIEDKILKLIEAE